jgi:hypothetical protein
MIRYTYSSFGNGEQAYYGRDEAQRAITLVCSIVTNPNSTPTQSHSYSICDSVMTSSSIVETENISEDGIAGDGSDRPANNLHLAAYGLGLKIVNSSKYTCNCVGPGYPTS